MVRVSVSITSSPIGPSKVWVPSIALSVVTAAPYIAPSTSPTALPMPRRFVVVLLMSMVVIAGSIGPISVRGAGVRGGSSTVGMRLVFH